jgi:hypothetical protein
MTPLVARRESPATIPPVNPQINWYGGWSLVLLAFLTGAGIGLFFHQEEFWGGYSSWRRRMTRLGHIAMAALGLMNVVYSIAPAASALAGAALLGGAIAMPGVCFLSAWKKPFRFLFFLPVSMLVVAILIIIVTGRQG